MVAAALGYFGTFVKVRSQWTIAIFAATRKFLRQNGYRTQLHRSDVLSSCKIAQPE